MDRTVSDSRPTRKSTPCVTRMKIQSCVFELIFRLMPVEGVALLLADGNDAGVLSTSYQRLGAAADGPFPLDDAVTQKALHDGAPAYGDKVVCFPLSTPIRKSDCFMRSWRRASSG